MNAPTCPSWCTDHIIEEESVDGSATDVHRGHVTRGDLTVDIETSPSWGPPHMPIILPQVIECDTAGARDLAAALLEAARLLDEGGA